MKEVNSLSELSFNVQEERDIILLITQEDCFKCTILKNAIPQFQEIGDVTKPVYVLDLDAPGIDREEVKDLLDIMSTPTLIGYKDGRRAETFSGSITPVDLMTLQNL